MEVYTSFGQKLRSEISQTAGEFSSKLDISELPDGIFFLILKIPDGRGGSITETRKFIKE